MHKSEYQMILFFTLTLIGQLYWLISIPRLFPIVVKLSGWGRWPNPWLFIASLINLVSGIVKDLVESPGNIHILFSFSLMYHHNYYHPLDLITVLYLSITNYEIYIFPLLLFVFQIKVILVEVSWGKWFKNCQKAFCKGDPWPIFFLDFWLIRQVLG